uniref:Abnormal spindle-like microcephaly-associated protein ASH domain-containing protein n=1 Tax=Glossina morsitans morsitans TaxID=37546 RepID=A0A1B0F9X8_GLOMM
MENNMKSNKSLFGDPRHKQSVDVANSDISSRLITERRKAMDALQKSKNIDVFKKPYPRTASAMNLNTFANSLDDSDYTLFRYPEAINISDLITDETIHLEKNTTNSFSSAILKDNTISFEPAEMTGRSTQLKKNSRQQSEAQAVSVEEILATSFVPKIRNLRESLKNANNSTQSSISSMASLECSSFTNYNKMHSLPHTADMSLSRTSKSLNDFDGAITFNEMAKESCNNINFSADDYGPGELMLSKFLSDEISCAEKFAAIPTKALSAQAKEKTGQTNFENTTRLDTTHALNTMMDYSLGSYFNKFSEDIQDISKIVAMKSPNKRYTSVTMNSDRDEDVTSSLSESETNRNPAIAGNINSTSQDTTISNAEALLPVHPPNEQESKDSGNASEVSYRESVCVFEQALRDLGIDEWNELNTNDMLITKQVKKPAFLTDSGCMEPLNSGGNFSNENAFQGVGNLSSMEQMILENKENLDPQAIKSSKADGGSRFMNSSGNMKKQKHNNSIEARLPLSPIEVDAVSKYSIHNGTRKPTLNNYEGEDHTKLSANLRSLSRGNSESPSNFSCSPRTDDSILAASPNLRFSKNPVKPMGNENILPSGRVLNEVSPEKVVSPSSSPHRYQLSSPSHTNNNHISSMFDVTSSNDYRFAVVCKSPANSDASSSSSCVTSASARGCSSRCSSASAGFNRDGKLMPIKTSATQLSWNSAKLRTNCQKTMHIKNISNKRLPLRIEVIGPGFQIVSDHGNSTIILHSQESRAITVNFCPTVRGVAVGKLSFYAPSCKSIVGNLPFLVVPLYAYGGHAFVIVKNILKGPIGCPFLPMGGLSELGRPMERAITIYNKGPLDAFASVKVDTIGLLIPSLSDTFEIQPEKLIIAAGDTAQVRIIFRPKRELIRKIMKKISVDSVMPLANLRVINGAEASRQRFLRLFERMTQEERSTIPLYTMEMFSSFPGEVAKDELKMLQDHPDSFVDMFCGFRVIEMQATLNHDLMNDTLKTDSTFLSEADDTILFRSIYLVDTPVSSSKTEENNLCPKSAEENQDRLEKLTGKGSWWVTPRVIELDLSRVECVSSIIIHNGSKSRQYYEVICNHRNFLQFKPTDGYIEPGGGRVEVKVMPTNGPQLSTASNLQILAVVCIENDRITVPVKFFK